MKYSGTRLTSQNDVEEHQVEREEHAEHARLHDEQPDHELLHALVDVAPRRQHDDRPEQRRERDHQHRQAVDAELVVHRDAARQREPRRDSACCIGGARAVEVEAQRDADDAVASIVTSVMPRCSADRLRRRRRDEQRADERQEDEHGEREEVHL